MTLQLLDAYSDPNPLALFSLTRNWKITLKILVLIFFRAPETHYIAPAFIWILVTFRRGDLANMFTRQKHTQDAIARGPAKTEPRL